MARIRGRDTKPELLVRSLLHRAGLRYSLGRKDLPGRPDIVLPKYRAVVFVHGCFWHRHRGCKDATLPGTRPAFWQAKFQENVTRDRRNRKALEKLGWRVQVVWECGVLRDPHAVLAGLRQWLGLCAAPVRIRPSAGGVATAPCFCAGFFDASPDTHLSELSHRLLDGDNVRRG
jgi:DNA mismatch endonuclease (patch repair protein)